MKWTDHEISLLAKAVSKFPSGSVNRWENIAEFVGRSVSEVTIILCKFALSLTCLLQYSSRTSSTGRSQVPEILMSGFHVSGNFEIERNKKPGNYEC